ncbi:MAG: serine hydrolase domain-containing protein [Armatimonadota bacterium]
MSRADLFHALRGEIRARLSEESLPSLAVAVAQHGEPLWEEAFGWADREARIPATPDTLYSLASISKPITATGLMVLHERGELDLDRPAHDYLGDARLTARVGDADDATLRRVANHTSGLPLHWHFFPEDEPRRRPPFRETLRRYGNLVTAPGERYQYSNLGYGVLDEVISHVSGQSFAEFMRREVFLLLGMTRASVGVGPGLEPYAAARYAPDGLRLPFYDFDHPGASAVFCSARDLLRFGMFHLQAGLPDQKPILTHAGIEEMQKPTATCTETVGYGVGWRISDEWEGARSVSHTGGMDGVNTILLLVPAERLAVVALCNAASSLPFDVAREVVALLVPRIAEQARRKPSPAEADGEPRPYPTLRGEWRGTVATGEAELPLALAFHPDSDVHVRLGSQLTTLVSEPVLRDGWLTGCFAGDIGTEDANRRPYHLHLDLHHRGDVLNGALVVKSPPGVKLDSALSHWTELERV